jgi:hypothetical protein
LRVAGVTRLRHALASRDPRDAAVMPLIEAHAARLEQLAEDRWAADAEAQARMLRAAQALYGLDGVTIGGGGLLAAVSCWLAASPGLGIGGAYVAARARRALVAEPDAPAVAEAASVALASDVLRRVRAVVGDRAALGYVLPDAGRLAADLGKPAEHAWATDVLMELIRALGANEPEIFLLVGEQALAPTLESLAEFFGAALIPLGPARPSGVIVLSPADLLCADAPAGWLYTTTAEIDPAADPRTIRAALGRLQSRRGR